jgi:hypothetical protein
MANILINGGKKYNKSKRKNTKKNRRKRKKRRKMKPASNSSSLEARYSLQNMTKIGILIWYSLEEWKNIGSRRNFNMIH